jgi:hypothetical protein
MKAIYFTASIIVASLLGLSGCSKPAAPKSDTVLSGKVHNKGKMAPQTTNVNLKVTKNALHIVFPNLQNNTGENFAATPCEAVFTYVDSGEDTLLKRQTHVYKGEFKANNNCALFTEQPSLSYGLTSFTQYARLQSSESGWKFELAKDMAGSKLIMQGEVR